MLDSGVQCYSGMFSSAGAAARCNVLGNADESPSMLLVFVRSSCGLLSAAVNWPTCSSAQSWLFLFQWRSLALTITVLWCSVPLGGFQLDSMCLGAAPRCFVLYSVVHCAPVRSLATE